MFGKFFELKNFLSVQILNFYFEIFDLKNFFELNDFLKNIYFFMF